MVQKEFGEMTSRVDELTAKVEGHTDDMSRLEAQQEVNTEEIGQLKEKMQNMMSQLSNGESVVVNNVVNVTVINISGFSFPLEALDKPLELWCNNEFMSSPTQAP